MAKKATTILVDDIDKESVSETVVFALDRIDCKIDLSVTHTNELREDFRRRMEVSRRVQGRRCRDTGTQIDYAARECNRRVRKWALGHGIDVSNRGCVPSSIMEQYKHENGK